MVRPALIVFAREPVCGQVKQRLAADIGSANALRAYRRMLDRTLRLARSLSRHPRTADQKACDLVISATGLPSDGGRLREFCRHSNAILHTQSGSDLGARMHNAIERVRDGNHVPVVLIGTDCPDFERVDIHDAFTALESTDVVIAPTLDGGYGLIGCRGEASPLFHAIPWGGSEVAAMTRHRCQASGLSLAELRYQRDVDTSRDWQQWLESRAQRHLAEQPVPARSERQPF